MGFIFLDIKTTGSTDKDKIVEIGALTTDEGLNDLETYSTLLNPHRPYNKPDLVSSWLRDAPVFSKIAPDFSGLLNNNVVVGYNIKPNIFLLNVELWNAKQPLTLREENIVDVREIIDTLTDQDSRSLHEVATRMGLNDVLNDEPLKNVHLIKQLLFLLHQKYSGDHLGGYSLTPVYDETVLKLENVGSGFTREKATTIPRDFKEISLDTANNRTPTIFSYLPAVDSSSLQDREQYLVALATVFEDNIITDTEIHGLGKLAKQLGLNQEMVESLHEYYLFLRIQEYVLTRDENELLLLYIAGLILDRDEDFINPLVESALNAGSPSGDKLSNYLYPQLVAGMEIALVGDFYVQPVTSWVQFFKNLGVIPTTTPTSETKLVIVGDLFSQFSIVEQAQNAGIPVLTEEEATYYYGS